MTPASVPLNGLDPVATILLWLAVQPVGVGAGLLIGGGVLITVAGITALTLLADRATLIENNLVGGAKFAFLAQVFAALLAFVLVDGGIRYTNARGSLQSEASALRLLDETVSELGLSAREDIRAAIRAYADTVIRSEFISMQQGRESPTAAVAINHLIDLYVAAAPATNRDAMIKLQADSFLTRALSARADRINAVRPGLKTLIWVIVAFNTGLAITFSWFFGNPSYIGQLSMSVLLTTAIMTVVYTAILLNHPFSGDLAISPQPFHFLLGH
ncbi:MAG: DUF4239 domain-containing protein [Alphaproteobacteria bacterium]|nr:DUF4239 domain-containing protein [Alphaproteobacteria bacterium]MBF0129646.1 DUF4239 domain-containing protein [Alphaproteobacteria bacterium]